MLPGRGAVYLPALPVSTGSGRWVKSQDNGIVMTWAGGGEGEERERYKIDDG